MSPPPDPARRIIDRLRAPGWRDLLRIIGTMLIAFAVLRVVHALLPGSEVWDTRFAVRTGVYLLAGLGLITGSGGRWLAIVVLAGLAIRLAVMLPSAFSVTIAARVLGLSTLIVVLLHPQARAAMDPEAKDAALPPRGAVRSLTWSAVLTVLWGPLQAIVEAALRG